MEDFILSAAIFYMNKRIFYIARISSLQVPNPLFSNIASDFVRSDGHLKHFFFLEVKSELRIIRIRPRTAIQHTELAGLCRFSPRLDSTDPGYPDTLAWPWITLLRPLVAGDVGATALADTCDVAYRGVLGNWNCSTTDVLSVLLHISQYFTPDSGYQLLLPLRNKIYSCIT